MMFSHPASLRPLEMESALHAQCVALRCLHNDTSCKAECPMQEHDPCSVYCLLPTTVVLLVHFSTHRNWPNTEPICDWEQTCHALMLCSSWNIKTDMEDGDDRGHTLAALEGWPLRGERGGRRWGWPTMLGAAKENYRRSCQHLVGCRILEGGRAFLYPDDAHCLLQYAA